MMPTWTRPRNPYARDPNGYALIGFAGKALRVEWVHARPGLVNGRREARETYYGLTARAVLCSLAQWAVGDHAERTDHLRYLARELVAAETAMLAGLPYVQDAKRDVLPGWQKAFRRNRGHVIVCSDAVGGSRIPPEVALMYADGITGWDERWPQ